MRGPTRQIAVVSAVAVNLVMNGLAGPGLLLGVPAFVSSLLRDGLAAARLPAGAPTGAISDAIPTGVTPAGWTFGIWIVIFLMLVLYAGFQAAPSRRGPRYDAPAVPFVIANLLTGLWQIPWLTRHFGVSLLVIAGTLASLVWLYIVHERMRLRENELWAMHIPGSYFLAWIAVATALNATILLATLGMTADAEIWAPVVIVLLGAVGAWLLLRTGDTAVAAVLLWAFAGIYDAHRGALPTVVALVIAAAAVVAAAVTGAIHRAEAARGITRTTR